MKTLTITLHDTDNCGSSLQAYALQHFLLQNHIENQIIDYVPKYTKNNGRPLKTFIRKILFWKETKEREAKFQCFKNTYLKVTDKKYAKLSKLRIEPPIADCYITGSDQLWNNMYLCGSDPAYYLDFIDGHKIAYAISVAREKIPEANLSLIKRFAKGFDWISIREQTSIEQLNRLQICSEKISHVCDPVLLNPVEDYDEIKGERIVQGKYIMVYLAQDIDLNLLNSFLQKLNTKQQYKIVSVGSYRSKFSSDIHISTMSPGEFLSLIFYSSYVVSNSFHATMFSLMYHKQFFTILPADNSTRIDDILNLTGLEQCAITSKNISLGNVISVKKYSEVQKILHEYSKTSGELLLKHLYNIGEKDAR